MVVVDRLRLPTIVRLLVPSNDDEPTGAKNLSRAHLICKACKSNKLKVDIKLAHIDVPTEFIFYERLSSNARFQTKSAGEIRCWTST